MEQLKNPLPSLTRKELNMGYAYLAFDILLLPVLLQLLGRVFSFTINETLINFTYFSVNLVCVLTIFSRFFRKSLLRASTFPKQLLQATGLGFLAYWACSMALSILTQIFFPDFVNINDSQIVAILGDYPVLMFLGTVIFAPIAEEMLHRGLVFGSLFQKSIPLAYAASAVLFASIHVVQYIGFYSPAYIVLALVQYLPAGIIFAWAYQRSGSIFAPIMIHAINNLIAISLTR